MVKPILDISTVSTLRRRRWEAGLSMNVLAARAGVSLATLRTAELAPHLMTARTAERVAAVLGIQPEDLK